MPPDQPDNGHTASARIENSARSSVLRTRPARLADRTGKTTAGVRHQGRAACGTPSCIVLNHVRRPVATVGYNVRIRISEGGEIDYERPLFEPLASIAARAT